MATPAFRPVILVTGCASGIGLALARLLWTQKQYRVIVTAREHSLEKLKVLFQEDPERFWIRPLDVTVAADRKRVVKEATDLWGGVNVLVNNAGVSYRSVIEHMNDEDEHRQMATNYFGPMGLIRAVIPHMRDTGRGKIINVSSVSGMMAMPTMASYSASKYALEGASEALWYETRPFGIDVTLVQPGFIRSKSFENVVYTEASLPERGEKSPYGDMYLNMSPFVAKMMNRAHATPEAIAQRILKVIKQERPPLWVPVTIDALVFYYIRRLFPRRLLLPFLFYCLPNSKRWGHFHSHKRGK